MSKYLVAIGHFAQPSVIELQARAIRANCGADTPIMVSDDHSETAFDPAKGAGPERGQWIKEKLLDVCKRDGLIYRDSASERLGHIGGDLGAFHHGLTYARDHGIPWVVKLSQRFVVDIPNWIGDTTRLMKKGSFSFNTACTQTLYHGRAVFRMRTECVVMETFPWIRPDVLDELRPRVLPMSTEELVAQQCAKINGGQCQMIQPKFLVQDRHKIVPGVDWKDNRPEDAMNAGYAARFAKYGVTPTEEFSTAHSCVLIGHKWGFGHAR